MFNKAMEIFKKYESTELVWDKKLIKKIKSELKAAGFKTVVDVCEGYGFNSTVYAYSGNDPHTCETIVEMGTCKNDNEHYINRVR